MDLEGLRGKLVDHYSQTLRKNCRATIVGIAGDKTLNPSGGKYKIIPKGTVEIQYISPQCGTSFKLLRISELQEKLSKNQGNTSHYNLWQAGQQREELQARRRKQQRDAHRAPVEELEHEPELQPEPPTAADPSAIDEQALEIGEFYKFDDAITGNYKIVQYTGISILRHGRFNPEIPEGDRKLILHFKHYIIDSGELKEESIDKEESEITTLKKAEPSILCPIIIEDENDPNEYESEQYINFNTTSRDLKNSAQETGTTMNHSNQILFVYPIAGTPVTQRELFNGTTPVTRFDIISAHTNSETPPFNIDREWGGNLVMDDGSDNKTLKDLLEISTDGQSEEPLQTRTLLPRPTPSVSGLDEGVELKKNKPGEILELLKRTLLDNLFFIKKYSYQEIMLALRQGMNPGLPPTETQTNYFYNKHFAKSGGRGGGFRRKSKKRKSKKKRSKKRKGKSKKSKTRSRR